MVDTGRSAVRQDRGGNSFARHHFGNLDDGAFIDAKDLFHPHFDAADLEDLIGPKRCVRDGVAVDIGSIRGIEVADLNSGIGKGDFAMAA
jgi:hypothetical protein